MKRHEAVAWDALLAVYEEAQRLCRRTRCISCGSMGAHRWECAIKDLRRLAETADRALIEYDAAEAIAQRAMEVTP